MDGREQTTLSGIMKGAIMTEKLDAEGSGNGKLYKWDAVSGWKEVTPRPAGQTTIKFLVVSGNKLYGEDRLSRGRVHPGSRGRLPL